MPLLFSLAIHNALAEVKAQLNAFLDDIYVLAKSRRVRDIYNLLVERLFTGAGIQFHTRKTRTWNCAGVPPPRMEELGPDVWSDSGIKILGTPVGDDEFVRRLSEERISKEQHLWRAMAWVPDLQCMANPSPVRARLHEEGMMLAMEQLLGGLPGDEVQQAEAKVIATMPMRLGGLRLGGYQRWPTGWWKLNEGGDLEGASRRCQQLLIGWTAKVSWVDPVGPT